MQRSKEVIIAEKKVFETLKCPVCYECVGLYLQQCINSHAVCSQCSKYIPSCPVCRGKFIGRPVLLAAIIEQLIQLFSGLSSGDKAVDVYLRDLELMHTNAPAPKLSTALEKVQETTSSSEESPIYNAALSSRAVEVFLQQQSSMMQ